MKSPDPPPDGPALAAPGINLDEIRQRIDGLYGALLIEHVARLELETPKNRIRGQRCVRLRSA
jgi:hypothetical protein